MPLRQRLCPCCVPGEPFEPEEGDGDLLLLDDEDGNPTEIIGADIEKDDT
jgi:hypothetical protein